MALYQHTSLNQHLQSRFGCRVYKISIDAGFSCPNRDGAKSSLGCIFCDETGSSSRTHAAGASIKEQVLNNIKVRKRRFGAQKFIAYFQSYTNTYAPVSVLKERFDMALSSHPDIIGLSVATRADCVDEEKLQLLADYRKSAPYVCVEYGMQTIHDQTLQAINRQETHADFLTAAALTQKLGLHMCAHVILGLPGESHEMQMQTARALSRLRIDGVKIHLLAAMQNTPLAKLYESGKWEPMSYEQFIQTAKDFIAELPPECIIHRIGGNGHPQFLLAPRWAYTHRQKILNEFNSSLYIFKT